MDVQKLTRFINYITSNSFINHIIYDPQRVNVFDNRYIPEQYTVVDDLGRAVTLKNCQGRINHIGALAVLWPNHFKFSDKGALKFNNKFKRASLMLSEFFGIPESHVIGLFFTQSPVRIVQFSGLKESVVTDSCSKNKSWSKLIKDLVTNYICQNQKE